MADFAAMTRDRKPAEEAATHLRQMTTSLRLMVAACRVGTPEEEATTTEHAIGLHASRLCQAANDLIDLIQELRARASVWCLEGRSVLDKRRGSPSRPHSLRKGCSASVRGRPREHESFQNRTSVEECPARCLLQVHGARNDVVGVDREVTAEIAKDEEARKERAEKRAVKAATPVDELPYIAPIDPKVFEEITIPLRHPAMQPEWEDMLPGRPLGPDGQPAAPEFRPPKPSGA